jgi:phage terminase large subunit
MPTFDFEYDFRNPPISDVFQWRGDRLKSLRKASLTDRTIFPLLKNYYKTHIVEFINDWGCTFDPRNVDFDLPVLMPFILFPRQEQFIDWMEELQSARKRGICLKSRDVGASWMTVARVVAKCLFNEGFSAGMTSYREDYVDAKDNPKALLEKARLFLMHLPPEFTNGWDRRKNSAFGKINFVDSNSIITGEVGKNIGRGGRATCYIVDEFAFFENPSFVEASLSMTTNVRLDLSTPNGPVGPFAEKWESEKISKFEFAWEDDPRKDMAWYIEQCDKIDNPIVIASELDRSFTASLTGTIIPAEHIKASVDAHVKLGLEVTGKRWGTLDIADEGKDKNGFCGVHGFFIEHLEEWSGIGSDIFMTVERAFRIIDERDYSMVRYDADGLGAAARGDSLRINRDRPENMRQNWMPFRGSGEVMDPDGEVFPAQRGESRSRNDIARLNKDYYENRKAQGWFDLKRKFKNTYRAVVEGKDFDPNDIISISSEIEVKMLQKLIKELSQPVAKQTNTGRFVVDKQPTGTKSPNLADAVMMAFAKGPKLHYTERE